MLSRDCSIIEVKSKSLEIANTAFLSVCEKWNIKQWESLKLHWSAHFLFLILDGRPQWEVEAKIIREKSQGVSIFIPSDSLSFNRDLLNDVTCFLQSCIVVEVPPYHSKTVASAVQVQFYVCNGKRKRSQSQRFTYLSGKTLAGISQRTLLFCFFFPPLIQTHRRGWDKFD